MEEGVCMEVGRDVGRNPQRQKRECWCAWTASWCCRWGSWCHPVGVVRAEAGEGSLADSKGPTTVDFVFWVRSCNLGRNNVVYGFETNSSLWQS